MYFTSGPYSLLVQMQLQSSKKGAVSAAEGGGTGVGKDLEGLSAQASKAVVLDGGDAEGECILQIPAVKAAGATWVKEGLEPMVGKEGLGLAVGKEAAHGTGWMVHASEEVSGKPAKKVAAAPEASDFSEFVIANAGKGALAKTATMRRKEAEKAVEEAEAAKADLSTS